jgi:hypothetical protein
MHFDTNSFIDFHVNRVLSWRVAFVDTNQDMSSITDEDFHFTTSYHGIEIISNAKRKKWTNIYF